MNLHKPLRFAVQCMLAVAVLFVSSSVFGSDYSFEIDHIRYIDSSGVGVDYGFTTTAVGPTPAMHVIPSYAVSAPTPFWSSSKFLWENSALPDSMSQTAFTGSAYRMSLQQPTDVTPEPWGLSSLGLWGPSSGESPPPGVGEWSFSVRLTNFANADTHNTMYSARIGTGTSALNRTEVVMQANWFSGTYQNVTYENALSIEAEVESTVNGETVYEWYSLPNLSLADFILGLDPMSVQLDLKTEVTSDGREFLGYYRINSEDETDWVLLASHMLPDSVAPATGFTDHYPSVFISAESVVPLPASVLLFAPALAGLFFLGKNKGSA